MRRSVRVIGALVILVILLGMLGYWAVYWPLRDPHPVAAPAHGVLALEGVRIYATPDAAALDGATVLIRDGRIAAIGDHVTVPADATVIVCAGCVVTAGFWNTHVHFTERKWSGADRLPAPELEAQIKDMLTSRGFTTVVDTGSNLRDTIPLRRRIEHGEFAGPKIYTAGAAQYPPNGIPYYLRDSLPGWLLWFLPQPATPAAAAKDEEHNIAAGADILKLFTGSYVARGHVLPMPLPNAKAAVEVAHAHGQLAFAHESNAEGVRIALEAGVDVLAHAADSAEGVDDTLLAALVARHMAMIPTLKMFATTVTSNPAYLDPIYHEIRRFHELGGELLFGTDVGYMKDYTTAGEFAGLVQSGLTGHDILRMLTTAPASRFGVTADKGTIEVGKAGDLTVLNGDPIQDPNQFASVRMTIRDGRVLWSK